MNTLLESPHRRLNPLSGEWVLVSPHRSRRPWQGQVEKTAAADIPAYDPTCYLCPGNARAAGKNNPAYQGTYVFDNDFPALLSPEVSGGEGFPPLSRSGRGAGGEGGAGESGLSIFQAEAEYGVCRVGCFSPYHNLTLPELPLEAVTGVVQMWQQQTLELGALDYISYVQVFENKGAVMGCSNPHPHNQIWAVGGVPVEPAKELRSQAAYLEQHASCLLCDYLAEEQRRGERILCANEHFTALVPFWAVWPFEVLLLSQRHAAALPDLTGAETSALADILRRVTARYDNLFEISFPYSMGFHQAPSKGGPFPGWHLHAHFYPPLLRSATVKKFMVGFEMLGMPQRDITPESAAERLRGLSEVHYKHANPA